MQTYNAVKDYQDLKDFEQFLLIESAIKKEFLDWTKQWLLEELKNVYKNWSNFSKSGDLMKVLLKWKEMLKTW